jgi:hypothetical protein
MKLARMIVVVCAPCLWVNAVFAQGSRIDDMSTAAIQSIARKQPHDIGNPKITLRIDDFADLAPSVLASARRVTTEIFAEAGVQTVWLDCPVYRAECGAEAEKPLFILRVVGPSIDKGLDTVESLGFAIPCHKTDEACLFYILYARIRALAAEQNLGPARMLGHVMAHEIGHALLSPNPHEPFSIMQATLSIEETERMLYFTSKHSKHLQAALLERKRMTH